MKTKIRVGHAYEFINSGVVVVIISVTFTDSSKTPYVVFQCVNSGDVDWMPVENFQEDFSYANE